VWGINPIDSSAGIRRESVRAALIKGAKFVVIDPKRIDIAKRADLSYVETASKRIAMKQPGQTGAETETAILMFMK